MSSIESEVPASPSPMPEVASSNAVSADGGRANDAPPSEVSAEGAPSSTSTDTAAEGAAAGAQAGGATDAVGDAGAPAKKRRRRRRKKHGGTAGQGSASEAAPTDEAEGSDSASDESDDEAAPDDAASASDGEAKSAPKKKEGKREGRKDKRGKGASAAPQRPPRERPAFSIGDIVFGKIVEMTDHALIVDLSGKARAIFDLNELELPDEPNRPTSHAEVEASENEGEAEPEGVSAEVSTNELSENIAAVAAPAAAEEVSASPADSSNEGTAQVEAPAPAGSDAAFPADAPTELGESPTTVEGGPAEDKEPWAPPVIREVGAHFVGIVHQDGGRGGLVVLTRHPNRYVHAKGRVARAFKEKAPTSGLVTGVIKGGVEVDVGGLRAFAPASHMDLRLGSDLHRFVGQRFDFEVTQYAKGGRDVVLSRRSQLEQEAKANREVALAKLTAGAVVDGVVRSVVQFGAFIDVGGVEGLVPLNEMSHNRSDQPHDVFKVGETVSVKIIRVDERGKVWLSRRATVPDPWGEVAKKYAVGTRHAGKIVRLQPFGAFVELEPGVDGLIHAADLSIKRIEHPSEVVNVGDSIDVVVASVDGGAHKIGLHPAPTGAAADETPQRVQLHKIVKVSVVSIDPGGLVVRILGATGRHGRGFIPASATGTPRGTELRKLFPTGKEIDAKIIELDPKRGEVKLSIRAMNEDTERSAYKQYQAQVKREAKFGTFGDLLAKKLGTPNK